MMVTAAAIGLGAGERLLSSSFSYSDVAEKLSCSSDFTFPCNQVVYVKSVIIAKKSSNYSPGSLSSRRIRSIKALKEHVDIALDTPNMEPWDQRFSELLNESSDGVDHVEALLLLQKSMLEKQWNLSAEKMITYVPKEDNSKKVQVTCSGTSARQRRIGSRQKVVDRKSPVIRISTSKRGRSIIGTEVLHNRLIKGYVKGVVSEELLTHTEVVQLSKKIKLGLCLEDHKSRF